MFNCQIDMCLYVNQKAINQSITFKLLVSLFFYDLAYLKKNFFLKKKLLLELLTQIKQFWKFTLDWFSSL